MKYSIGTAAKATGKVKSTIHRDIKSGKISADRNEDGSYSIDASELIRVYPEAFDPNRSENTSSNGLERDKFANETGGLQAEVEALRERLRTFDIERERERGQLTDQIDDLRTRLDLESEERRKLTSILTDQRTKPDPAPSDIPTPKAEILESIAEAPAPMQQRGGLWSRMRRSRVSKG